MTEDISVLKNLLNLPDEDLKSIHKNLNENSKDIQMLDYIYKIDLEEDNINNILKLQKNNVPAVREKYFEDYRKMVKASRTLEYNLTNLRLNPYTEFENNPTLFFGMGGGSKALCKALPFDVLTMILTGEEIRRKMNISKCKILLANRITYTNIPRNSEFSKNSIDKVMNTEKKILDLVLKKFGFSEHWETVLQTDIEDNIGKNEKEIYENIITKADDSEIVGGHHYAIEMADIYSLVGRKSGGIKLGWFIRNLDKKNGGYIMDEQPFHARFVLFMAKQNLKNKVTFAYANAGARIYPGPTGELEKESPYICYQPYNRLLLSPYEKPIEKLKKATEAGGGFNFKYYRNFINGIIDLFEKYVMGNDESGKIIRIPTKSKKEFKGSNIAEKVKYILNFIYDGEDEFKDIWKNTFEI